MPAKRFVPVATKAAGSRVATVEEGATLGATVGLNLWLDDGTLVTKEMLFAQEAPDDELGFTYWRLIQEVPPNVVALEEATGAGLFAVTGDGTGAMRSIEVVDGELTESNGSGVSGNPLLGLADVPDVGGGELQKTDFDAKGRKVGTSAATTDDLPEGATNLYFTNARADARITVAKADPNGIASLVDGKLDAGQLPALAITETFVVNTEAAMLALDCQQGDVAVRMDLSTSFILTVEPASTLANWQDLLNPTSPVTSVFGRTGPVVAATGDYTPAQVGADPAGSAAAAQSSAQSYADGKLALKVAKAPVSISDLNSVSASTVTPFESSSTAANSPAAVNLAGIYLPGDSGAGVGGMQIAGRRSSGASDFYIRSQGAGSWAPWRTLWHNGNFDPATKADNTSVIHTTGNETALGQKSFTDGIRSLVPADFWSSAVGVYFGTEGYFGTNGNFGQSFRANGYRNSSTAWTSMGRGGNAGASGIDLRPNGIVMFGADNLAPTGFDVTWRWEMFTDRLRPVADNVYSLGDASHRASVIWAGTGTISTSDGREKTPVVPLTESEIEFAKQLAGEIGTFQWLAMIDQKGAENARHHVGVTVQRCIELAQAHGLDPFRYAFICYDEWPETPEQWEEWPEEKDDDGNVIREAGRELVQEYRPAGNRYSLRPDQLALFLARGFDARLKALGG